MHDELVIDTSYLNAIKFDPKQERVTVGAGAFTGHVYEKLAISKQGLGGGNYGSVCMAGITLGGGVGVRSRASGLLCDQLEGISLVDAQGQIVHASSSENSDLFWATRGGGGGTFGIVTMLKFRTAVVPTRTLIYIHIAVPESEAVRILHDWQYWTEDMGREVTTHLMVARYSGDRYLIAFTGEATLALGATRAAVQRLFGYGTELHENYIIDYYTPHGQSLGKTWDKFLQPIDFISKSDFVQQAIDEATFKNVLSALKRHHPGSIKLTFEALGGAVRDLATDATSYAHRAASYVIEYRSEFRAAEQYEMMRDALQEIRKLTSPHVTGGAYVNYADPELGNWAEAYWGSNLPRLITVKRKWDPDNIFQHAQSVPLI